MNKQEYTDYEKSVKEFFEQEKINCLSQQPIDQNAEEYEYDTDPYFSWRNCDCCNRRLAGNRYLCNGYNPTKKEVQNNYSVCEDCIYYVAYGCLDDTTMLEINDSE